jgi:hypothetical protein
MPHSTTQKANSDYRFNLDEESDDIQGSKENRSYKQQSARAATTNDFIC